jgi:hypothetical protein
LQHQDLALTGVRGRDQLIEDRALDCTAEEQGAGTSWRREPPYGVARDYRAA